MFPVANVGTIAPEARGQRRPFPVGATNPAPVDSRPEERTSEGHSIEQLLANRFDRAGWFEVAAQGLTNCAAAIAAGVVSRISLVIRRLRPLRRDGGPGTLGSLPAIAADRGPSLGPDRSRPPRERTDQRHQSEEG
jgi:hypothetical protein